MAQVVPYINFAGKAQEALNFYKSIFGGEAKLQLAKDGPNVGNTPPEKMNQVFHAEYNAAAGFQLLGSDMMSDTMHTGGDISLALMCDNAEQLKEYFDKLSEGGNVVWPVRDSEWGSVYGQCVDQYGIQWMLNADKAAA